MAMMPGAGMALGGAGGMLLGGLLGSKGRAPGLSPEERLSMERKSAAQGTLSSMFQDRAKDPFQYVMSLDEQKYSDQRRDEVYNEQRGNAQQSLMGAMNRTGTLGSGATNYNLMRFGQQTLRDKSEFYFQDRSNRLQEREGAVQNTFNMGLGFMGTANVGGAQTDVMNARSRQHNQWRNRWASAASSMGGQAMGYGMGQMAGKK